MKEGASKGDLEQDEDKQRQELARFQSISGHRIPSCIKMLNCKTNLISVRGRLREEGGGEGEEKGRRREGEREEGDSWSEFTDKNGLPALPKLYFHWLFFQRNNWNEYA